MNKSDLIKNFAEKADLSVRDAEEFVNLIFNTINKAMTNDERIEIRGFGSFIVKKYKEYDGRNPKTGEKIKVPAKKLPIFKAGKELSNRINGKI